jgi:gliding motility-related protein
MKGKGLSIFPSLSKLLPNWNIRYSGLVQLPWFREVFRSFNINHSYRSIYTVGSYFSFSSYQEYMNGLGFIIDATSGNPIPNSMFNVSTVSVNEAFSPLLGIDMTFNSGMTAKLEYRTIRSLNLSMTSIQLNEAVSRDWVVGLGYRINDFKLFGLQTKRKAKNHKKGANTDTQQSISTPQRNGVNHDLNLNLDFSFRRQASLTRDIASQTSNASSGNSALRLSFTADYTLSRMLTMSFFYDFQNNTPLLSSNSYPTSTRDFGLSVKFSLTR